MTVIKTILKGIMALNADSTEKQKYLAIVKQAALQFDGGKWLEVYERQEYARKLLDAGVERRVIARKIQETFLVSRPQSYKDVTAAMLARPRLISPAPKPDHSDTKTVSQNARLVDSVSVD